MDNNNNSCYSIILKSNSHYVFCLTKHLICCLLIVNKVIVKFRNGVRLRDQNMGMQYKGFVCAL